MTSSTRSIPQPTSHSQSEDNDRPFGQQQQQPLQQEQGYSPDAATGPQPTMMNMTTISSQAIIMERVLFTLHERACNYGLRWTSARTRRWLEHCLLVGAICSFGVLLLLHRSFVVVVDPSMTTATTSTTSSSIYQNKSSTNTYNCLPTLPGFNIQHADITHIVVLPPPSLTDSIRKLVGIISEEVNDDYDRDDDNYSIKMKKKKKMKRSQPSWKNIESRVVWRKPKVATTPSNNETNDDANSEYQYYPYDETNQRINLSLDDPLTDLLLDLNNDKKLGGRLTERIQQPHQHQHRERRRILSTQFVSHYMFSNTNAYLMLPPDNVMLDQLNVQYVFVSPSDQRCFGDAFVQFLIFHCFVGPDTILRNWFQQSFMGYRRNNNKENQFLSSLSQQDSTTDGYIYNVRTQTLQQLDTVSTIMTGPTASLSWKTTEDQQQHHRHQNPDEPRLSAWKDQLSQWVSYFDYHKTEGGSETQYTVNLGQMLASLMSKLNVLVQTSFLFFFCTTLVSFTLRETQERMMDFTRELSRRVQQSLPVSDLIATHLIQNLVFVPIMVGMMFFLIEFYNGDKYLAFSTSSIVWSVESFSIVSLRSTQGLQYFPRFFFLLFLLFHVYQSAYSQTGFVYLALTVVWCFMFHSMVFFWHRFELPAVALGYVTVDRPRLSISGVSYSPHASPPTHPDNHGQQRPPPHPQPSELVRSSSSTSRSTNQDRFSRHGSRHNVTSNNGGHAVPSHPSFSTSSTRHPSGLFRNNHEDDNSTGSMLYFMGGEVVVHRGLATRSTSHGSVDGTNNTAEIQNSSGPRHVVGTNHVGQIIMNRTDSNLSLPSTLSHGQTINASTNGDPHLLRSSSNIGLDVSHHQQDDYPDVTVAASSETIPTSNHTPARTNGRTTDNYEDESGGLQAIFSRLTPRHRNTLHHDHHPSESHAQTSDHQYHHHLQRQPPMVGMMLDVGSGTESRSTQATTPFQRVPPTFPELPNGENTKKRR